MTHRLTISLGACWAPAERSKRAPAPPDERVAALAAAGSLGAADRLERARPPFAPLERENSCRPEHAIFQRFPRSAAARLISSSPRASLSAPPL